MNVICKVCKIEYEHNNIEGYSPDLCSPYCDVLSRGQELIKEPEATNNELAADNVRLLNAKGGSDE